MTDFKNTDLELNQFDDEHEGEAQSSRGKSYWTLSQALAWVRARNHEAVNLFSRDTKDKSMSRLHSLDLNPVSSFVDLAAFGENGGLKASGIFSRTDLRKKIDATDWLENELYQDARGSLYLAKKEMSGLGSDRFDDVLIKADDLIAAFPERVHLNDVWERWVNEFHSDLIDPNRYRPAGNGVHYRNDKLVEYDDYDESEYAASDGGRCVDYFRFQVRRLTAFSQSGAMSSSGQWQIGDGGFEQIIIRDDERIDGPRSWPARQIKKFDADVWLDQGEVESLFQGERDRLQIKKDIDAGSKPNVVPNDADIINAFKEIKASRKNHDLPRLRDTTNILKNDYHFAVTNDSITLLWEEHKGVDRGVGRPSKKMK